MPLDANAVTAGLYSDLSFEEAFYGSDYFCFPQDAMALSLREVLIDVDEPVDRPSKIRTAVLELLGQYDGVSEDLVASAALATGLRGQMLAVRSFIQQCVNEGAKMARSKNVEEGACLFDPEGFGQLTLDSPLMLRTRGECRPIHLPYLKSAKMAVSDDSCVGEYSFSDDLLEDIFGLSVPLWLLLSSAYYKGGFAVDQRPNWSDPQGLLFPAFIRASLDPQQANEFFISARSSVCSAEDADGNPLHIYRYSKLFSVLMTWSRYGV